MLNQRHPIKANIYDDDVDDETFLKHSRRPLENFDDQILTFQERKKIIENRTIDSAERSVSVLRDSEQIGIATAEELMRQREKLEKTDKQLDEINATLRFSQKHINGIKSVFSSLKNYVSGRNDPNPSSNPATSSVKDPGSNQGLTESVASYDRYENHPTTRLRDTREQVNATSGSKDISARLDANLQEMCSNISRLKGLASDMSYEIDSQNDLIGNITDKAEKADLTIARQNKDMHRLMKQ